MELNKTNHKEWFREYIELQEIKDIPPIIDKTELLETYEGMTPQEAINEDYSRSL